MNSVYQAMGGQRQPLNPMQMLQVLRNNPASFLAQAGYQVPEGMTNPNQIIQHLLGTGQVTQARIAQAQRMAQNLPHK